MIPAFLDIKLVGHIMIETKLKIARALVKARLPHRETDNATTWFNLSKQLRDGEIKPAQHQRGAIYSNKERDRILTAFLLGRGIGCIEIVEDCTGNNRSIEDGLQRITTIKDFFYEGYEVLLAHKEYKALQTTFEDEGITFHSRCRITWNDLLKYQHDDLVGAYIGQVKKFPVLQTVQVEVRNVTGNDFQTLSEEKFRDTNTLRKRLKIGERIAAQYGESIHDLLTNISQYLGLKQILREQEVARKEDIRIAASLVRMLMGDTNLNDSPGEFKDLNNPALEKLAELSADSEVSPWIALINHSECVEFAKGQTAFEDIMCLSRTQLDVLINGVQLRNGKGLTSLVLLNVLLYHVVRRVIESLKCNGRIISRYLPDIERDTIVLRGGGTNASVSVRQALDRAKPIIDHYMTIIPVQCNI